MDFHILIKLKDDIDKRISQGATCVLLHFKDGHSTTEISKIMNISQRTVQRYLKKFHETGTASIQKESRGRKSSFSSQDIENFIQQGPLEYGFILDAWLPSMLQTQTGASYAASKRILEKNEAKSSVEDLSININELQNQQEQQLGSYRNNNWIVHVFKLGNDRGKRESGKIGYISDFYCFLALNLEYCSKEALQENLSGKPYFFSIWSFSRVEKDNEKRKINFRNQYIFFLHKVIKYVFDNFGHNICLLMFPSPKNQSALFRFQISEKYELSHKPEVKANFLRMLFQNGYSQLQNFELELKKDFAKLTKTDKTGINELQLSIAKRIDFLRSKLATHFRKP